jgi:hypothetical protein
MTDSEKKCEIEYPIDWCANGEKGIPTGWSSTAESENRAEPGQCTEPEFSFDKLNLAEYDAPSDIEIIFDFEYDSGKLYPADGEDVPDKVYLLDVENKTDIDFPLERE